MLQFKVRPWPGQEPSHVWLLCVWVESSNANTKKDDPLGFSILFDVCLDQLWFCIPTTHLTFILPVPRAIKTIYDHRTNHIKNKKTGSIKDKKESMVSTGHLLESVAILNSQLPPACLPACPVFPCFAWTIFLEWMRACPPSLWGEEGERKVQLV